MTTVIEQQAQLAKLIARIALRDQAAFRELYRLTASRLLAVSMRMLRDQGRAEDVLQEAFIGVWRTADRFAIEKSQPMTWLINIVRNRTIDALRTATAQREESLTEEDDDGETRESDIEDDSAGPLDALVAKNEAAALRRCLERLEPGPRQSILLAFYEGLSHAELAEKMNQPLGTIKSWVRRSLERLKDCLGAFGEGDALRSA
jgi:RNA polymerase sigma-70 factor (ECF subfamily)